MRLSPGSCARIDRGGALYPPALACLEPDAPESIAAAGATGLLQRPLLALLCSVDAPGEAILAGYDLARRLRDAGVAVVGGFQSPVERECLGFLLRGTQPVVAWLARDVRGMRLPRGWAAPLAGGRMLLLSAAPPGRRRPTAALTTARNRMVAALATTVVVIHATPGGRLHRLVGEALRWGRPVLCPDLPGSRDLLVMGARPLHPASLPG